MSVAAAALAALILPGCGGGSHTPPGVGTDAGSPFIPVPDSGTEPRKVGQTEFSSLDQSSSRGAGNFSGGPTSAPSAEGAAGGKDAPVPAAPGAPSGREAAVEEADIYRIDHNRLFYLNTYRGFLTYDLTDTKNPKVLSRLPVYGYPVEMFVQGNTVYALLRDVLYLSQKNGRMQFERRNVSQLITIDVTDPTNPRLLKAIDIVGLLQEGVSRKVENTIYVVSSIPQSYWWGWAAQRDPNLKEQAWVYSFNVADPQNPILVNQLKVFEGGSVQYNDQNTSYQRYFKGVAISATSNVLMVVENWDISVYQQSPTSGEPTRGGAAITACGSYDSDQLSIVSLINVSDPSGKIDVYTKFQTSGSLTDQFKQTYEVDPVTKIGTYYGIFARRVWSGSGCQGTSFTQNSFESWDVSIADAPKRLARVDFGKPEETVRATAFDLSRKVAYAITARNIDPLYPISFADRSKPSLLPPIDGLSGDMSVFRLIGPGNGFLLGIGRDNSETCTGLQGNETAPSSNIATSIIDVRDLSHIKLVQRKCVAIENAAWVGSDITWNLDQAHKMIGMHSDATANVITVPVSYVQKTNEQDWWWYRWQTAVGIMSWDLSAYDPAKAPADQTVLKNYGTFVHPQGQVLRSIVFTHEGAAPQRTMVNLSDTHISVANLQDLAHPVQDAIVEVAPFKAGALRFGTYIVEQVQNQPWYYGGGKGEDRTEFRVKAAGGDLDDKPTVASFALSHVTAVYKVGETILVALTSTPQPQVSNSTYVPPITEAQVFDLTDPAAPRKAGKVAMPQSSFYWGYAWCGNWFWGAYWYSRGSDMIATSNGLHIIRQDWDNNGQTATVKLLSLDVSVPDAPQLTTTVIDPGSKDVWLKQYGLAGDPVDPRGFYLNFRTQIGETKIRDASIGVFRDYAQRWDRAADGSWAGGTTVNLPGRLTHTWLDSAGARRFLAQDYTWRWTTTTDSTGQVSGYIENRSRLSLLRQATVEGKVVAELIGSQTFEDASPTSVVIENEKLFMIARNGYGYGGYGVGVSKGASSGPVALAATVAGEPDPASDRFLVFDLAGSSFSALYDQRTDMYSADIIGVHAGKLVVSLSGDGWLIVDVANPAAPSGLRFVRTLGWANAIEFAGDDAYIPSGYYGTQHFSLSSAPTLPPSI